MSHYARAQTVDDRASRPVAAPNDAEPAEGWLHTYNHHRGHTAFKGQPPAGRVPTSQVNTRQRPEHIGGELR